MQFELAADETGCERFVNVVFVLYFCVCAGRGGGIFVRLMLDFFVQKPENQPRGTVAPIVSHRKHTQAFTKSLDGHTDSLWFGRTEQCVVPRYGLSQSHSHPLPWSLTEIKNTVHHKRTHLGEGA